ncbi:alpha/beta hydrolase fold protein [Solidesulfovibrio fructosivorans JJ]]|uniref:Alpha/beta hydrolase fold protein n=2 Tax=Solidesulfovibrio fructosivorans TaxID=878 RepID=E1JYY8_SOLFR|nr:alpha/beta hydrolase fold protein [Solidesulfovibrio fructosivorans JJ]]
MSHIRSRSGRHAALLLALVGVLLLCAASPLAAKSRPDFTVANLPTRLARVGDGVIAYKTIGSGPPLLLLTGYACSMDSWDGTLVGDLAAGRRLILCDYPGVGRSTALAAPLTLRGLADVAAGLLTALAIPKADVLGWSMGAVAALELALAHPGRVGKVACLGAAFSPETVVKSVARLSAMTPEAFRDSLFPQSWRDAHPEAFSRLPRQTTPIPAATLAGERQALASWPGFAGRLRSLETPVLLVVGDEDWVTPPGESAALARQLPRGRLVRMKNAGHWLQYQDPAELARLIGWFLKGRPAAP